LPDGRVLVAGGISDGSKTQYAELYDPISGTWTRTGDEACAAGSGSDEIGLVVSGPARTATLLANGKVLVAGGGCAELYDSNTGSWTRTRDMNVWRGGHTASRLADGRVLVAGGIESNSWADVTASTETYDQKTGVWTLTAALAGARSGHTSTVLRDGRVFVAGGYYPCCAGGAWLEPYPLSSTEIFDPLKETSTSVGSLASPRDAHTATLLPNGKVLIAGGEDDSGQPMKASEFFDPATGTSSVSGNLNLPRKHAAAIPLPSGDVFVTGGGAIWGTPANLLHYENISDAERYDTTSGKWLPAGQQLTPRMLHTATLLQDGRVLVAGGVASGDGAHPLVSAELYLPPRPIPIGPGFTGSWYDPAQIGHGLFVEVLPDSRFLAAWFTFDPAGAKQSWFLGVGTYSGDTATIATTLQPTGGRWIPNFDPARVVNYSWGTLKFTFADCNHGRVDFASSAGYGVGSMNLTRLTQPAGLSCP
jgi:Galactose oxidase, central domain